MRIPFHKQNKMQGGLPAGSRCACDTSAHAHAWSLHIYRNNLRVRNEVKETHRKRETTKENDIRVHIWYMNREAVEERIRKRVPLFLLFLIRRKTRNSYKSRKSSIHENYISSPIKVSLCR